MKQWTGFVPTLVVFSLFLPCLFLIAPMSSAGAREEQQRLTPSAAQTEFLDITIPVPMGIVPAFRPPIHAYTWQTFAGSPDPVEVRWILVNTDYFGGSYAAAEDYIRNNPNAPEWYAWHTYTPPDVGTSWTTPVLDFGPYVFAVQGKDGSGNVDDDFDLQRNMRRIQVSPRVTGPLLTVTGDHITPIMTTTTDTPVTQIELDGGTPVSFCWTADASFYGGVAFYRYGWDLTDPDDDDDPNWAIPFTPFTNPQECSPVQVFGVGVHTIHVESIDNDGFKSRVPIEITYEPGSPVVNKSWGSLKALYRE